MKAIEFNGKLMPVTTIKQYSGYRKITVKILGEMVTINVSEESLIDIEDEQI